MKKIDTEKLLQWAVNDELPKGRHVWNPVWRTILSYSQSRSSNTYDGARQQINNVTGGYVPGDPDEDAILIGRTVMEFDRIDCLNDEHITRSLLGDLIQIDPGVANERSPCLTAALAFNTNVAGLMLTCAILKRTPSLDLRCPKPKPVKRTNGRPLALREDADGDLVEAYVKNWRNDFVGSPRCPLEWMDPRVEDIAEQRAEYTIWWHSLAALASRLAGKLSKFAPTQPSLPARPWSAPPARQPVIWRGTETRKPPFFRQNGAGSGGPSLFPGSGAGLV